MEPRKVGESKRVGLPPPPVEGELTSASASAASGKEKKKDWVGGGPTGSGRVKVPLKPGHGLMAWMHHMQRMPFQRPRRISMEEVRKHSSRGDVWMVLAGKVYDVSAYMDYHPGGPEELMRGAGEDASSLFAEVHRWVNFESLLAKCFLGYLDEGNSGPAIGPGTGGGRGGLRKVAAAGAAAASSAKAKPSGGIELKGDGAWHRVTLESRKPAGHLTEIFRFSLPSGRRLGLEHAGQHVHVRVGGGELWRPYTPISPISAEGYFELLIKLYPDGKLSSKLKDVKVGSDIVEVRGPKGEFRFRRGLAMWGSIAPRTTKQLLLAGGGSGITPLLQIAQECVLHPRDSTKVFLACYHHSPPDVLAMPLLRDLVAKSHGQISLAIFVSTNTPPPTTSSSSSASTSETEGGDGGGGGGGEEDGASGEDTEVVIADEAVQVGRVGVESLRKVWPAPAMDQVVAWCGPSGFNAAVDKAAREMMYDATGFFTF